MASTTHVTAGWSQDPQKIGRLFGWLFIATFATSIPARFLFASGIGASFDSFRFVPGAVDPTTVYLGALLEFGLIVTNVATAVVLYPVVKRRYEILGLGYVTARIMESAFIAVGLVSILSAVNVAGSLAAASGAEAAALTAQGQSLVATYDWAFQFGPGLVVGFGNGLILGFLMYRSRLVPRPMAALGLVGGPMLILRFVLILFGAFAPMSGPAILLLLPEIAWELSLGIYTAWKGFKPGAVVPGDVREEAPHAGMAIA